MCVVTDRKLNSSLVTIQSIDYFRYLYVAIQEIELMVDEIFLLKLIQVRCTKGALECSCSL